MAKSSFLPLLVLGGVGVAIYAFTRKPAQTPSSKLPDGTNQTLLQSISSDTAQKLANLAGGIPRMGVPLDVSQRFGDLTRIESSRLPNDLLSEIQALSTGSNPDAGNPDAWDAEADKLSARGFPIAAKTLRDHAQAMRQEIVDAASHALAPV